MSSHHQDAVPFDIFDVSTYPESQRYTAPFFVPGIKAGYGENFQANGDGWFARWVGFTQTVSGSYVVAQKPTNEKQRMITDPELVASLILGEK